MAQIRIDLAEPLLDGMDIKFKAPCNCNEVTGLKVYYPQGETTATKNFTFRDTHGNDLTGLGNLFFAGTYVKVLVDTQNGYAYLQNADNNSYIESKLSKELIWRNADPTSPFAARTIDVDIQAGDEIQVFAKVSSAATYAVSATAIVGKTGAMLTYTSGQSNTGGHRYCSVANGKIAFQDAYQNGNAEANSYLIPLYIYRIKGAK